MDDDTSILDLRKILLDSAGYNVITASSGEEALQMLSNEHDVDLVLLDYLMPGMNGDELAESLRSRYPNLPLIAVSAVGQLPQSLLNMVDSHVQKGQNPEVLLSIITGVLAVSDSTGNNTMQTVLCVEDERIQLRMRTILFESAGFVVLQAQSASDALYLFRSHRVDAVVMDYWLSGKNGTAVAEEMKRLRPRVPIIILSGFVSLPGEGVVVDAWLQKTESEPEDVVNEVRRLISLRSDSQQILSE